MRSTVAPYAFTLVNRSRPTPEEAILAARQETREAIPAIKELVTRWALR